MSFVILQAVMKRLEERSKARLFAELGSTMKLPRSSPGQLSLEVIELADHERPPMIGIPEYLEKRRLEGEVATTVEPKAQGGQGAKGGPGGPTGAGVVGAAGVAAPTRDGPGVSS